MNSTISKLQQIYSYPILGDVCPGSHKKQFATTAKKFFKLLNEKLNLNADIRFNAGGNAVSGEATLHSENIYVQFSQGWKGNEIMFRTCKGKKDYCGGSNNFLGIDRLAELEQKLKNLIAN